MSIILNYNTSIVFLIFAKTQIIKDIIKIKEINEYYSKLILYFLINNYFCIGSMYKENIINYIYKI